MSSLLRLSSSSLRRRLSSPSAFRRLLPPSSSPRPLLLIHTSSSSSAGAAAAADGDPHRRHASPFQRRHEEESRAVRVAVWWDFENCNIPVGVNVFRLAHRIISALRASGIRGPVTINAFGDISQLSRSAQEALLASGVTLTHVPHSGKNSSDRSFMADLVNWVSQNPPPAHFFLISSDRDFATILHRLRMSNYNVLLSSTDTAPGVLCSAATIMWPWSSLVKGENIMAKHFNHPPDGIHGSWYGHYKGALDDPFRDAEQTATSWPEEAKDLMCEVKPRPVPKAVVNGIRQVLHSYREGINMSELRSELRRNNITMDKDFFGHKKFSQFLSSMPSIVKFIRNPGDGQPLVVGIRKRAAEVVEPSSKLLKVTDIIDRHQCNTADQNLTAVSLPRNDLAEPPHCKETDTSVSTSTSPQGKYIHCKETDTNVSTPTSPQGNDTMAGDRTVSQPIPTETFLSGKESDLDNSCGASACQKGQNAEVEEGFFLWIWKGLFGSGEAHDVQSNTTFSEAESTESNISTKKAQSAESFVHAEEVKAQRNNAQSNNCSYPLGPGLSHLDGDKSPQKDKAPKQSEEVSIEPLKSMGFLTKITNWWISPKSDDEGQRDSSQSIKDVLGNQITDTSAEHTKVVTRPTCVGEDHSLYSPSDFWHGLNLDGDKSPQKDKAAKQSKEVSIEPLKSVGFLTKITNWWISPKSDDEGQGDSSQSINDVMGNQITDTSAEHTKVVTQPTCVGEDHGLYSLSDFWHGLNLFLLSEKGSDLISKSKSREQLVHGLQTKSSLFTGLDKSHVLHLVNLLISEKKWVEEYSSQTFPFKLSLPAQESSVQTGAHGSSGLSCLFSGKKSQSNLNRPQQQERRHDSTGSLLDTNNVGLNARPPQNILDLKVWFQKVFHDRRHIDTNEFCRLFKRDFNQKLLCSFYGHSDIESLLSTCLLKASNYQVKKKPPNREEILSDCQKLLTEFFEEYPEGFNSGLFRPRFLQKYGYALDHGMLGYPKLASLLQIMPGVRVELSFILPAAKFTKGSIQENAPADGLPIHILEKKGDVTDSGEESNGEECAWSELGPVSDMSNHENAHSKEKAKDFTGVSFSEEEFSDSEDDGRPRAAGSEEKDSSLLQILDSWYTVKEGGEKDKVQSGKGHVDCSRSNSKKSSERRPVDVHKMKARPSKPYAFVLNSGGEEKEKLVDSILGSLKKAGDTRL